jgi:hypothetical protein
LEIMQTVANRPMWTKGPARIEGDKITLDGNKARPYLLFEESEPGRLLMDLAELHQLGLIVNQHILNKRVRNPALAKDFARRHGMLWHQPQKDGGDCQESWRSWLIAGYELSVTIALYEKLREAITTDSTENLRAFLRNMRDVGNAYGAIPANDELLEHVSILLAEQITRGLEGCSPTLLAACSLERRPGEKEGPPGDFRASINPSNLVAVAYYELVALIESKAQFRECVGCGKHFRLNPEIHHRDRTYCENACYDRTRKRRQRAKNRESR